MERAGEAVVEEESKGDWIWKMREEIRMQMAEPLIETGSWE